jgi:uncharacterized protein (TIGR02594 family)
MISTRDIQLALVRQGFNVGKVDGINGPKTEQAILTFNAKFGMPPTIRLTESGLKILGLSEEPLRTPWINEVNRYMGVNEVRDRTKLIAWLRSGGGTVGDPTKLPWCADLVETAIKLTLPSEPFPGKVGINPYYSLNWLDFGIKLLTPCFGCIAIFVRPGGGHIAFIIGVDPIRRRYRIRGGNQSDSICDCWIDIDRCKGLRWPTTYNGPRSSLPIMDSKGAVISRNEA